MESSEGLASGLGNHSTERWCIILIHDVAVGMR